MKVLYTNAQSVANAHKVIELNLLLLETNPDILALTETWLNEQSSFKIWNTYTVFRKDIQNRQGGCALLAVLKPLSPVREEITPPPGCDAIAVSCKSGDDSLVTFVSFYCPPDVDLDYQFLADLEIKYPKL